MRFLLDNALSPQVAALLRRATHDATHVRDYGMARADDTEVLALSATEDRVLVTADTDLGTLLAPWGDPKPSVIILRRYHSRRSSQQAQVISANLGSIRKDLEDGAIVVLDAGRLRVRRLPIGGVTDRGT